MMLYSQVGQAPAVTTQLQPQRAVSSTAQLRNSDCGPWGEVSGVPSSYQWDQGGCEHEVTGAPKGRDAKRGPSKAEMLHALQK